MPRLRNLASALLLSSCGLAACGDRDASPTGALPPGAAAYDDATMAHLDDYEREALALVEGIGRGDAAPDLVAGVERLFDLADAMMPAFIARHPECSAYLQAAGAVRQRWRELDVETLERDYHDDAALPSQGTTPACYHIKDLVVHPASAAALLVQDVPDPAAARREIDEVIAHLDVVRRG
jgi:hypothetical protein